MTPSASDAIADLGDIFAGADMVPFDTIASLVAQYQELRKRIEEIAAYVQGGMGGAMSFFFAGNTDHSSRIPDVSHLFATKGAIAALNASYWQKAMLLTDVLDMMPQKRRDEWHEAIEKKTCPEFEEKTVRDTFADLMASRAKFLAERVDGIFRSLSGAHVTNRPEGFYKRMIIANVLRADYPDSSKCGTINDLRCVVAKLMRRDEPKYSASDKLVRACKDQPGQWVQIDGGAMKIRVYIGVGTAHLEIHPDMAWRLNGILASLYPKAIPPQFRERPKRQPKDVPLIQRPLPFAVLHVLAQLTAAFTIGYPNGSYQDGVKKHISNAVEFRYRAGKEAGKQVLEEAEAVLESLGGVKTAANVWQFDYRPDEVLTQVCTSGCVPDDRAHQFYPTRAVVAEVAIKLADIGPTHRCLEPQAGLGGLAEFMPKDRTVCIEVSPLRAQVLAAKGFTVECGDFLKIAAAHPGRLYDRIVMNPPFDQGRWRAHLEAAAALLAPGGRLVAVLPIGAKGKADLLPSYVCEFPHTFDNAFAGTSQSVVLLVAVSKQPAVSAPVAPSSALPTPPASPRLGAQPQLNLGL